MPRRIRTWLAFALAPLAASLEVAMIQATVRPAGEGPTWIDAFLMWVPLASLDAYLLSYTLGLVGFAVLRALRRESIAAYAAVGAIVAGFVPLLFLFDGTMFAPKLALVVVAFALLGASVAVTFCAIRGPSESPIRPAPPEGA